MYVTYSSYNGLLNFQNQCGREHISCYNVGGCCVNLIAAPYSRALLDPSDSEWVVKEAQQN